MPAPPHKPNAEIPETIVRAAAVDQMGCTPESQSVGDGNGFIESGLEFDHFRPLERIQSILECFEVIDCIRTIGFLDDFPERFPIHRAPPGRRPGRIISFRSRVNFSLLVSRVWLREREKIDKHHAETGYDRVAN